MTFTLIRSQKQKSALVGTASSVRLLIHPLFITLGLCSGFSIPALAQVTASGDGTVVTPAPSAQPNTINITGGTQQGTNLFHSFGKFDLNIGQTANFDLNSSQTANVQPGANVQNILGRINGGLPSAIDGKIQVTGGNASGVNLYLMNPAGIIFGQNASLDINGAFTATTARAIRFGTGEWFNALGGTNYPAIDPKQPIDFAFTDNIPNKPGGIFNAANLTTKPGQSITLVGGTVISTGDIKTAGGNISISTAPGGKYVQIKADGSILRLDLPTETKNQINALNPTFAAPSLPALLTGRIDSTATGIKIEGDEVKLVGDKTAIEAAQAAGDTVSKLDRPISSGDIITKNINTSNPVIGGAIYLDSSKAILAGEVTTSGTRDTSGLESSELERKGGTVFINAQAEIKTGSINSSSNNDSRSKNNTGGNVTLSNKTTADIIVDSINTTSGFGATIDRSSSMIIGKGGDLTVDTTGVFRLIGLTRESINTSPLGKINIKHGSTSFVTGVTFGLRDGSSESLITVNPIPGFTFPERTSGSRGAIITTIQTNGTVNVVYQNGAFVSLGSIKSPLGNYSITGGNTSGADGAKQPSNTNEQAAKQKLKQDCTPSSTAVAANSTTDPNRAEGNASAPSAAPCQLVTGTAGGTLQILNNRE